MNRIHAIALTAASAAILSLGCGAAVAQTVSGRDPYVQGYAAGASAKQENSFDAFDRGYRAGQVAQSDAQSRSASAGAYDKGYQAGVDQANNERQQAYNQGYADRRLEDQRMASRAFDDGFDAGAYRRSRSDLEFP